jgi:hypothetical protein
MSLCEQRRGRSVRRAGATLGIAALVAYLLLPAAHALATEPTQPLASQGVAFEAGERPGHTPLECPICDRLGHARHVVVAPVVSLEFAAVPVVWAETLRHEHAHAAPALDRATARAPPAFPLFS